MNYQICISKEKTRVSDVLATIDLWSMDVATRAMYKGNSPDITTLVPDGHHTQACTVAIVISDISHLGLLHVYLWDTRPNFPHGFFVERRPQSLRELQGFVYPLSCPLMRWRF